MRKPRKFAEEDTARSVQKGKGPKFTDGNRLDDKQFKGLVHVKKTKLFDITDIRKDMEVLTEDEEEMEDKGTAALDMWNIKRDIRKYFKRMK